MSQTSPQQSAVTVQVAPLRPQHFPLLRQMPEQHWLPSVQVPPPLTQQIVPEQVPPLGQVTHAPPQLVCPDGHTQLVPEQLPPVGQVTQVPPQQVWPVLQAPQLSVPPQLSEIVPQITPCAAQVVGVQQVPLVVHTCPAAQQPVPQLHAPLAVAPVVQAPTQAPPQLVWPEGQQIWLEQ